MIDETNGNSTRTVTLAAMAGAIVGVASIGGSALTLFSSHAVLGIAILGSSLAWGAFVVWLVRDQPGATTMCLLSAAGAASFAIAPGLYFVAWYVFSPFLSGALIPSLVVAHQFREPSKASIAGALSAAVILWLMSSSVILFLLLFRDHHTFKGQPPWWLLAMVHTGLLSAQLAALAGLLGWFAAKKE